jgi:formamidopyrimidine-DNA glycosylase
MPELPDIAVYIDSLQAKLRGATLQRLRVLNPFVLRTALPPLDEHGGPTPHRP